MKDWQRTFFDALSTKGLEEARAIRDKHFPKKLYQFCAFSIRTLTNLSKNRIWLSNPSNFNDPYDCALNFLERDRQVAQSYWNDLNRRYFLEKLMTVEDFMDAYSSTSFYIMMEKRLSGRLSAYAMRMFQSDLRLLKTLNDNDSMSLSANAQSSFFIGCLTESYKSVLMWAHYANHHRGLCIEYELSKMADDTLLKSNLYPVTYSSKLLDGSSFVDLDNDDDKLVAAALYKNKSWSYEKEWRVVLHNPEQSAGRFIENLAPSAIIAGARMPFDEVQLVFEVAANKKIPARSMFLNHNKFELRVATIA